MQLVLCLANALQAAGRSVFVMKSEVITNLLIFVPLAYLFGVVLDMGLVGAWLATPDLYNNLFFINIFKV